MPTFAVLIVSFLAAEIISAVLTAAELPLLRKLKAGQAIREEGPQAHLAKAGTPTMGGIAFIATLLVASVVWFFLSPEGRPTILAIILSTLAYGGIGFYDDYLKVTKHQNEGLTSKQKMALQILIGIGFSLIRYFYLGTKVFIPFMKDQIDFGFWIIPFTIFVFVAMTNAVNLTDGLDGLASSVTFCAALFLGLKCGIGTIRVSGEITTGISGNQMSMLFGFILAGACMGFLFFNHHPAKLFMGDTGSLALGACLTGIAMTSGFDFALPIIGLVYVIEALSVIIQVFVFKTQNGRRFFRMAPIHHHFELGGWSENKIAVIFSAITVIMGVVCLIIF